MAMLNLFQAVHGRTVRLWQGTFRISYVPVFAVGTIIICLNEICDMLDTPHEDRELYHNRSIQ